MKEATNDISKQLPVSPNLIERRIHEVRGHKTMLDSDLAELYGVSTKALNQAVVRNLERFPDDFMFQLSAPETKSLRSQTVTSEKGRGGRRYAPRVFTEQGVAMLSSVLRSERAVAVNIAIMRTFVRLRAMITPYRELSEKVTKLEQEDDVRFKTIFVAIRELMKRSAPPDGEERSKIGFGE